MILIEKAENETRESKFPRFMNKHKKLFSKTDDDIHLRSKYTAPSRRFSDWVTALGFEKTALGRFLLFLEGRFHAKYWAALFLFCLVLSSIIFYSVDYYFDVQVGEVATFDIKSPVSFEIVDQAATNEKRRSAEQNVPPIFDFDNAAFEQVISRWHRGFVAMRRELKNSPFPKTGPRRDEALHDFLQHKPKFEQEINVEIPTRLFDWLAANRFSSPIENAVTRLLLRWSGRKITDGQGTIVLRTEPTLLARTVGSAGGEEFTISREEVYDLQKRGSFEMEQGEVVWPQAEAKDRRHMLELARTLLVANLTYNRQETLDRRVKAKDSVPPVVISIKKGQMIVDKGTIIQPNHMLLVNEINSLKNPQRKDFVTIVVAFLFFLLIAVFFSYLGVVLGPKLKLYAKDVYAMGTVVLLAVASLKAYMFVVESAFSKQPSVPVSSLLFTAPVAAGPMLVGLMIGVGEIVWLFTVFISIAVAFAINSSFDAVFFLLSVIGGVAAARGVRSCQKRSDIYMAGLRVGVVNALVLVAVTFLQPKGEHSFGQLLLWNIPLGMAGGLFSSMVTMALIPGFESFFNYTTDVKLLELSSLNHPLMKDMIVKAPGTYHHSLVVGSMCEVAAEEIGANPLLARVMAYYHDIGKMEHAQYFIENQRPGHNPHDHISPHMSKTVLIAHVKDGAEMGLRAKLGREIIDGILQHHGTTLINYFYNKAVEGQDADIDTVNEEDFRYPGPKPQFKEAALLMLADSIEAAARALEEPTANRLTTLVKNIIQNKFIDGQLDQCDLTLKDLGVIEECYRRVILGIYHQRIDYPTTPPRLPPALPPPSYSVRTVRSKRGQAPS